jgi:hypothetical protein
VDICCYGAATGTDDDASVAIPGIELRPGDAVEQAF